MTTSDLQNVQPVSRPRRSRDEDEIDLAVLFANLVGHKWTIAITVAIIFSLASIYAFTATPIYRAVALLEAEQKSEGISGMAGLGELIGEGVSGNKEIVLIQSYKILGETVDRLHLNVLVNPRFFPLIGSRMYHQYTGESLAEPLFGLGGFAWGGEILEVDRFEITGELSTDISSWELLVGDNNAFTLFDEDGDEVLTGRVGEAAVAKQQGSRLNLLVRKIVARPGQSFSLTHIPRNRTIENLKLRLNVVEEGKDTGMIALSLDGENRKNITEILNAVSAYYVESNVAKHIEDAQQVLDFIDDQLPKLKKNLDAAQRELQSFRQKVGSVDMEFEAQSALSQIVEYEKMIIEMELKREELRRQFNENHPNVAVTDKQIEKMRQKIKHLEGKMHVLPEHEWEFIQRSRDVEVASALYLALLNKGQELRVAKASTVANVRVIDAAQLLSYPVKPRKLLILIVGLFSGVVLGVGWVALRIVMHKGVEDPEIIERETGIPVFANIPHSESEVGILEAITKRNGDESGEAKLLAFENDSDLAMEAMRSFRTNMRFTMKGAESNVIIISGPAPSIGKSFFSANYSAIAAKDGQQVLLIDADMRKGHLHKQMGVPISPGLSELIAGDISMDEAIHEIGKGFHFISCGERPPNSAELVSSEQFQALLEKFKQRADLVIIDTPPILAVADASIIAQYGGLLFLLVRSGQHPMGEILAATSRFQKSGVKVTGILVNDVKSKASSYGYAYEYK
jgi:tyrosine-protein kinase Etk/Wzc